MNSFVLQLEQFLASPLELLPLSQSLLRPVAFPFKPEFVDEYFPGSRSPRAAFAALLLRAGKWEESHLIAQDVDSQEGSYVHGILHRIEPDYSNAKYWFRRVPDHPIFPKLLRQTESILARDKLTKWRLGSKWDPLLFVDWCEEAYRERHGKEEVAQAIQMTEWHLLFNWCRS
jgi:hypothetical protein